jgi:hypothetical protein
MMRGKTRETGQGQAGHCSWHCRPPRSTWIAAAATSFIQCSERGEKTGRGWALSQQGKQGRAAGLLVYLQASQVNKEDIRSSQLLAAPIFLFQAQMRNEGTQARAGWELG